MEWILENALVISVTLTIIGIAFAAFIASPYEIYFDEADDVEDF